MKTKQPLTVKQLNAVLNKFHKKLWGELDPLHLLTKAEYKEIRAELSMLLDSLAYPIPELKFNKKDTEMGDVTNVMWAVLRDFKKGKKDEDEIPLASLLKFKRQLLHDLDEMTER